MRGPRWAPSRPNTVARPPLEVDENWHPFTLPIKPFMQYTLAHAGPGPQWHSRRQVVTPAAPPPPPPPPPAPSKAATVPHDVLARIFDHSTANLSLDKHDARVISKVALVCKKWLQATKRVRVVAVSNHGRPDWHSADEFSLSRSSSKLSTTRLWLRLVFHDPNKVAFYERTTREAQHVVDACPKLTHLRLDVASLPVEFLSLLSLPALTHLELYNSKPRLRESATGATFSRFLIQGSGQSARIQPQSLRIEPGLSSRYVRHFAAAGLLRKVTHLSVRIELGKRYNEDFHLADFGSVSLERFELQILGPFEPDYNYHCYRQRLYAAVRDLAPRQLHLEAVRGGEADLVLSDLLHFLATSEPSHTPTTESGVIQLSVKGRADAPAARDPLPSNVEEVTIRAERPSSDTEDGKAQRHKLKRAVRALLFRLEASGPARTLCLPGWMNHEGEDLSAIRRTTITFISP